MTEVVILDEMLIAGMEALRECRKRHLKDADICVAVYLAMEAIREIADARRPQESVH